MLKLIHIEFFKLRRKKLLWFMLLCAFVMPFFAFLYFHYFGEKNVNPMVFYKWSAFGFTQFIILPFVLGMLCVVVMHDENRYHMFQQLWIVPVDKLGLFFSKFFMIFLYATVFMLLTAVASILFGVLPEYFSFSWNSTLLLLERCLEIAVLITFSMLPVLALSASQKGYLFPTCAILIYIFAGFFIASVCPYFHPISCTSILISRNGIIPGLIMPKELFPAILGIFIWSFGSVSFATIALNKRK